MANPCVQGQRGRSDHFIRHRRRLDHGSGRCASFAVCLSVASASKDSVCVGQRERLGKPKQEGRRAIADSEYSQQENRGLMSGYTLVWDQITSKRRSGPWYKSDWRHSHRLNIASVTQPPVWDLWPLEGFLGRESLAEIR